MKSILLLGAGRSASVLISYLLEQTARYDWRLTIADSQVDHLHKDLPDYVRVLPLLLQEENLVRTEIEQADLVISMLPATFHPIVANWCLSLKRNLITASYVAPEIKDLAAAVQEAGLLFVMEAGLDPGIDHMSAVAIIRKIKEKGGQLQAFKSYTGGLIAPASDNNPWHYKFTWNPRNVVLAGQGTARFLEEGQYKYIPYQQLFKRTQELTVPPVGALEGYANRDSLLYQEPYDLPHIPTLIRGTLRRPGFCQAWHQLIALGLTDDSYRLQNGPEMTYRQFIQHYLPAASFPAQPWYEQLAAYLQISLESEELDKIKWLEFPEEPIGLVNATPAQILEKLLSQKWQLGPEDKDMIVMQHIFEYTLGKEKKRLTSSLVVLGEDNQRTAMAKTVGLPVGIIAKLILLNDLALQGVIIPTIAAIYEPVLAELAQYGVTFVEEESVVTGF